MPTGPKGEKRPADAFQRAVKVARIATGEDEADAAPRTPKHGAEGGVARARKLTESERKAIAKKAATRRWKKAGAARDEKERP